VRPRPTADRERAVLVDVGVDDARVDVGALAGVRQLVVDLV
jgi:hypothetical protein